MLFHKQVGEGAPLVILHGLFGSLDNWMGIAKALGSQFTVYLVDLRNHGRSFHDEVFDYPSMSQDLVQWSQSVNLGEFHLMGHSMGGKVAMHYAQANPEKLRKLVVVDIAPKAYPVHHESILQGLGTMNPLQLESRQQADQHLSQYVPEAGVRQFLLKNLKRNESGQFDWKLNLPAIRDNITAVGAALPPQPHIDLPALFVRGQHSDYINEQDMAPIKGQFPQAVIETIAGAGHWVHSENPQAFLQVVGNFMTDHSSPFVV